jgi:acyl carrier protein
VAAIWAEVLKLERIGRHDNFFELGGHSLLAMKIISRIRAKFGADIQLKEIFEADTVQKMGAVLNAQIGLNELLGHELSGNREDRYL